VWVTTGAEPEPGAAPEAPLEEVVTGAVEEEYREEPDEEAPVVALALDPAPPAAMDVPAPPATPGPVRTGCVGFTCLVTWIVRRMTLVRMSGFAASKADF